MQDIVGTFLISGTGLVSDSAVSIAGSGRVISGLACQLHSLRHQIVGAGLNNGDFETAGTQPEGADFLASWTEVVNGDANLALDKVSFAPKKGISMDGGSVGSAVGVSQAVLTIGSRYRLRFDAIGENATLHVGCSATPTTVALTDGIESYEIEFVANSTTLILQMAEAESNAGVSANLANVDLYSLNGDATALTAFAGTVEASLDGDHWATIATLDEGDANKIVLTTGFATNRWRFKVTSYTLVSAELDSLSISIQAI